MTQILHIITSPRGAASQSKKLGDAIIEQLKAKDPNVVVKEHDLSKHPYPHLEEAHIAGFFTPEENRTPEQIRAVQNSDKAVAEIKKADVIVIDSPMYNFSITSGLKAYFDHIARAQITFKYSEKGAEGLLKGKKAYIAFASAGIFSTKEAQPLDFATPYIKHFLHFIGIDDVTVFRVEGTAIPGMHESALVTALETVDAFAF